MPLVEAYEGSKDLPLFVGNRDIPCIGEAVSKDMGGYFSYFTVVEFWHREEVEKGEFRACIGVKLDD